MQPIITLTRENVQHPGLSKLIERSGIWVSIGQLDSEALTAIGIPANGDTAPVYGTDDAPDPLESAGTGDIGTEKKTSKESLESFKGHLERTRNTICGKHPISLLLKTMSTLREENNGAGEEEIKFLHYSRSSDCKVIEDSSVSYASAYVRC